MRLNLPILELAKLGELDTDWLSLADIERLAFPELVPPSTLRTRDPTEYRSQRLRKTELMRHIRDAVSGGGISSRYEETKPWFIPEPGPALTHDDSDWLLGTSMAARANRTGHTLQVHQQAVVHRGSFAAWLPERLCTLLPPSHLLDNWIGKRRADSPDSPGSPKALGTLGGQARARIREKWEEEAYAHYVRLGLYRETNVKAADLLVPVVHRSAATLRTRYIPNFKIRYGGK